MDIQRIQEFLVLSDSESYTSASDKLYMNQSSLSRHIKELEEELGVTLFERSSRRVSLTDYGREFLPYAARIWEQFSAAQKMFTQKRSNADNTIKVHMAYNIGPKVTSFCLENPQFPVILSSGGESAKSFSDVADELKTGKLDLYFGWLPEENSKDFASVTYSSHRIYAILPPGHRLLSQEKIPLAALSGDKFVFLPDNSFESEYLARKCREAGFEPKIVLRGATGAFLSDAVNRGVGVTLLLANRKDDLPYSGRGAVPIDSEDALERRIYYRKGKLTEGVKAFLFYMQNQSFAE